MFGYSNSRFQVFRTNKGNENLIKKSRIKMPCLAKKGEGLLVRVIRLGVNRDSSLVLPVQYMKSLFCRCRCQKALSDV